MSRLIEDYLTEAEHQRIAAVIESNTLRFDRLIEIAGLDPLSDFKYSDLRNLNFCGADLRGFDFTGSDLRGGLTDERTRLDESTILDGAKVQWISEREVPIVQLMQEVQSAQSSDQRSQKLQALEKKFGKTDHVISFVVNAALDVTNTQAFLDFADFLPSNLPQNHRSQVVDAGVRALRRKFSKSRARTGREATTIFAASTIIKRLAKADSSFASDWFASLAEVVDTEKSNDALLGTAVKVGKGELIAALESMK